MKKAAVFLPLAAGACWGASGIFVRTLKAAGFSNLTVMCSRSVVGTVLVFFMLFLHDRELLRLRLRDLPLFLSVAINGYLLMNTCYNLTALSLTLSLASILLCLCPIFVLLFGAVFFQEKITPVKICCMLAALTGCALISGVFDGTSNAAWSVIGILTGLGSAFFNAIYTVNSKQLTQRGYAALTINFYVFLISSVVLAPFANWPMMLSYVTEAPIRGISFYLAQALITSILPNFLYTTSIEYIDSGKASILSCGAEPTSAMILGIFVYAEIPSALGVLGLVITISALFVLTKNKNSQTEKSGPTV